MAEPKIETKIVKKLSMKVIEGGRPVPNTDGTTKWITEIVGVATGTKTGVSNYGEWTALIGNFMARTVSKESGNELRWRTAVLFLPDIALNFVTPALDLAGKGAEVKFAFRVGINKDDTAATGYVYTIEPLIEPEKNDPLELLASNALKPLPAPAKTK